MSDLAAARAEMTTHDPELLEQVAGVIDSTMHELAVNDVLCDGPAIIARAVLDAITTSPRYALVELPEPDYTEPATEDVNGYVEWAYSHGSVATMDDGTVMWGNWHIANPEKVRYAGSCLLAAARHAETTATEQD